MGLLKYILESDNRKHIKKLTVIANKVELLREQFAALTDEQLRAKTDEFRLRLKENNETLDDILPEAFATVREAATRVLGMTPFFVQIMGGIALHQGRIAEMRTGEGKTLVATLPSYLNALTGEGVHVVTVNDYLARRDAEWMGSVHRFLGLTVGVIDNEMSAVDKKAAYNCDITYGANSVFGFDYLRDNQAEFKEAKMQRKLNFALIDEVDSILIDDARTPLIISGIDQESEELYHRACRFVKTLTYVAPRFLQAEEGDDSFDESLLDKGDVELDEEKRTVHLSAAGIHKAEEYFRLSNLADINNTEINHFINNALKARFLFLRDKEYIVKDKQVFIVDEGTGRVLSGRRYSNGLHQAIEAKEGVAIQGASRTTATITYQNLFRLYRKLSGMTGTAKTEEAEFRGIYRLDVVVIPTNRPSQRVDEKDVVFFTEKAKLGAIIEDIAECFERGQPVLVGTTSVEKSEALAAMLKAKKIFAHVLNAKRPAMEAEIVAQAGRLHAVTIATNMAGRGTDILLGGNPAFLARLQMRKDGTSERVIAFAAGDLPPENDELREARERFERYHQKFIEECALEKEAVKAVGGLRIIGTERHESRRIDNQLRGRAGRQGDIGSSIFYMSFEDDLLRIYGGDRFKKLASMGSRFGDAPLPFQWMTSSIINAQKRIEGMAYSSRKRTLEYDNVLNAQRKRIYADRDMVLENEVVTEHIYQMMRERVESVVDTYTDPTVDWQEWDLVGLNDEIERTLLPAKASGSDSFRRIKVYVDFDINQKPIVTPIYDENGEPIVFVGEKTRYEEPSEVSQDELVEAAKEDGEEGEAGAEQEEQGELIREEDREQAIPTVDETDAVVVDKDIDSWLITRLLKVFKPEVKLIKQRLTGVAEQVRVYMPPSLASKLTIDEIKDKLYSEMCRYYEAKRQRHIRIAEEYEARLLADSQAALERAEKLGKTQTVITVDERPLDVNDEERKTLLRTVDRNWQAHIDDMDNLREGIALKGYANHDPVVAYAREGFEMFQNMIQAINEQVVAALMCNELSATPKLSNGRMKFGYSRVGENQNRTPVRVADKPRPNDPCPCGKINPATGKVYRYKKCCGKV